MLHLLWEGTFVRKVARPKLNPNAMKPYILLFIALFTGSSLLAQSDQKLVEKTLHRYIEGSSYNKLDMLENAFATDATLYLTIQNEFKRLSPKEYISFFEDNKRGQFNGRTGTIVSTAIEGDIATAKVEILVPDVDWKFVDLFLLKDTEDGWKIISKTATRKPLD